MTLDEFIKVVQAKGSHHPCFYHFTDTRNLDSIAKYGLLSLRQLSDRGIKVPAHGGNEWSHDADRRKGLDDHVHLCLMDEHPMEYIARKEKRLEKTTFLQIRPEVIRVPGLLASLDVSNKAGVDTMPLEAALNSFDLQVVYQDTNWKDGGIQARRKATKKYEILVPQQVSKNLIVGF